MSVAKRLLTSPALPWRIRNGAERWLETKARARYPSLYRLLHYGQLSDPVRSITRGPEHHFFGYYDKSPWGACGKRMLAHQATFNDRPPGADDPVRIGVVHLEDGQRFEPVAVSHAWNWQQGAMLQWHPKESDRWIVYNDRRERGLIGVVRDLENGREQVYEQPLYALTPDGALGFSLNFARLHTHRPGYGYPGVEDPWAADPHPSDDGLYSVDMSTGRTELVVSLDQLARLEPRPSMHGSHHWLNHIQLSPGGSRLAFFHIWRTEGAGWAVRLYTYGLGNRVLSCVLDTEEISHYDWEDDRHLLVWARRPDGSGKAFLHCDVEDGSYAIVGEGTLTEDGHCSFSPDRKWVLNDTYPDRYDMRTLMLFRLSDSKRFDLARLYSPKARWWGEIRCDLHPRWSRDGRQVCIDSVHDGTRQMYVVDVAGLVS